MNAAFHLDDAFQRFFKKQGNAPKCKTKRKSKKSYTTNFVSGNIMLGIDYIKLPKVGIVRANVYRTPNKDWKLKSVTVSQDAVGDYYASVLF